MRLLPASSPFAHPTFRVVQCMCHLLRAPVRMSMGCLDELRTPSDGLWGPMRLNQKFQSIELVRSQLKRTLGVLIMHGVPRLLEDDDCDYKPFSF